VGVERDRWYIFDQQDDPHKIYVVEWLGEVKGPYVTLSNVAYVSLTSGYYISNEELDLVFTPTFEPDESDYHKVVEIMFK